MLGLHRDQLNAVLIQRIAHAVPDGAGQLAVTAADHLALAHAGDGVLHAVVHQTGQAALSASDAAVQGLDKLLGIVDPPQDEAVGHHGLFVLGDHVGHRQVIQQHRVGHGVQRLDDRQLEADARSVADVHHLAELAYHGVLVLLGDDEAAVQKQQQGQHQHHSGGFTNVQLFHVTAPPFPQHPS